MLVKWKEMCNFGKDQINEWRECKVTVDQGNRIVIKSLKEKQKLKIGDSHLFQDLSVKNKVYM